MFVRLEAEGPADVAAAEDVLPDRLPPTNSQRPKDAASLILIDRAARVPRVLVGRRHARHVFMPETYVFPGGRRDRADGRVAVAADLHPLVAAKLLDRVPASTQASRARALAVAALRETREETGLLVLPPGSEAEPAGPLGSQVLCARHHATPPESALRYPLFRVLHR